MSTRTHAHVSCGLVCIAIATIAPAAPRAEAPGAVALCGDRDIELVNPTSEAADTLHVAFSQPVTLTDTGELREDDSTAGTVHHIAGNIGAGEHLALSVHASGVHIERWWLTRNGVRVGGVQHDPMDKIDLSGTIVLRLVSAIADAGSGGMVVEFSNTGQPSQVSAGAPESAQNAFFQIDLGDCDGDVLVATDGPAASADAAAVVVFNVSSGAVLVTDEPKPAEINVERLCGSVTLQLSAASVVLDDAATKAVVDAPVSMAPSAPVVDDAFLRAVFDAIGTGDPFYDLNNDGAVDAADLGLAVKGFGATPVQPAMGE
jgi:hypothetical protein